MVSPSLNPVSTRMPGPLGSASRAIRPGEGGEVAVGVLGVEARLDGVPPLRRGVTLQPAARRDVQLGLHQVDARGDLGDRVLDLQARVDLEEREQPLAGVVEELDGARALVVDREHEPLGRSLQLGDLPGVEDRGGRLLDDLLVAPLHGAVAHAQRPRGALPVGDDLHLDVPGARHQALQEHDAAAERARGLLARQLVGLGQLVGVGDHPDTAAAASRGRLQHQRVTDPVGRRLRLLQRLHRAAAPRRDGHADLFGDQLGADLVAQPAHRLGARADERHADLGAQLGERRVLGHEAPAHPGRVRAGLDQGLPEDRVVQIRPVRGESQVVGDVGLADERGRPVGVGVQGDGLDLCARLRC
ncbi:hypothetical protein GCM10018952_66600 [Streptosporangium vulgare]